MTPRVRFAPSPTGLIHVGNVRAALLNWLYARARGGSFILRLDDTDPERSRPEFAEAIIRDLCWLGLEPDETYKQSDRCDAYDAAADKLKAMGRLYPCYETPDELDIKRKLALGQRRAPVYDRAALDQSDDDRARLEGEGRKPHWRFKLELPARVEFVDLIRGHVSLDMASVSDPILIRSDGSYLYTLPSVVDDLDLSISHVIRGEDHVTNSAVQTQIFEALGGSAPEFAHFALFDTKEGSLSKRSGALSVQALRDDEGLEPMAILSLLARLGTSEAVVAETQIGNLIEGFDFNKLSRATAHFNMKELRAVNARVLHALEFDEVKERLDLNGVDEVFWNAVRPNLNRLSDAADWWHIVNGPITPIVEDADFTAAAADLLPSGTLDENSWKAWTGAVAEATGAKGKALFMPLRQALTGQDHGPEMRVLLPLIGVDKARARLRGEPE